MIRKTRKKNILTALFIVPFLVAGALIFSQIVYAVPLADPGDQFLVNAPRANSELSETVDIQFKLYDDENSNPEYEIALYQTNCINKYGVIAVNDYSIRGANNVYTKSFNTDGPMIDRPAAADGNYCLKVCTTLKNGTENYSVCDLRQVTLEEKVNSAPIITSTPPNKNYIVGQRYGYDVNATDADGDSLTFTLANAPDFLQINPSTGEITSKGDLLAVGSFGVLVYVDDGQGGRDSQQFEVVVVEKPSQELPEVLITNPGGKDIVTEDLVDVEWSIKGIENIEKIELFYSTDGSEWTLIDSLGADARSYQWDFSEIPDGDYYLRVLVTDVDGNTYENVLGPFSLNKPDDEPIEDAAGIIDVVPEEDSEVQSADRIEATLVASEDAQIAEDSLKVTLNDNEITESCALQEDRVICSVTALSEGKHKVDISFEDSAGEKGQKSWFFDVVPTSDENNSDESGEGGIFSGINTSSLLLVFIICMVALFLIIIPWMLFSIWRNRGGAVDDYDVYDDYGAGVPDGGGPYSSGGDINVNVDPRTDLDSSYYTGPPTDTAMPDDMDMGYDEYAIGEGDIGGGEDFTPVEPVKPSEPVASVSDGTVPVNDTSSSSNVNINVPGDQAQTSSSPTPSPQDLDPGLGEGFDEDDIPDWLKGEDTSDPVDTKGQELDFNTADEKKEQLKGADPYSDYGLAQKEE